MHLNLISTLAFPPQQWEFDFLKTWIHALNQIQSGWIIGYLIDWHLEEMKLKLRKGRRCEMHIFCHLINFEVQTDWQLVAWQVDRHGQLTKVTSNTSAQEMSKSAEKALSLLRHMPRLTLRAAERMPSSRKEVTTYLYSTCTRCTAMFWTHDPLDQNTILRIICFNSSFTTILCPK